MRPSGPCLVVLGLLLAGPGPGARAQGNDSQTEATAPAERGPPSPGSVAVGAGTLGDATTGQSGGEAPVGPHNPPDLPRAGGTAAADPSPPRDPSAPPAAVLAACDAIADPERRAACRSGRHR